MPFSQTVTVNPRVQLTRKESVRAIEGQSLGIGKSRP